MKNAGEPFGKEERVMGAALENPAVILQYFQQCMFILFADGGSDGITVAKSGIKTTPPVTAGSIADSKNGSMISSGRKAESAVAFLREPAVFDGKREISMKI